MINRTRMIMSRKRAAYIIADSKVEFKVEENNKSKRLGVLFNAAEITESEERFIQGDIDNVKLSDFLKAYDLIDNKVYEIVKAKKESR